MSLNNAFRSVVQATSGVMQRLNEGLEADKRERLRHIRNKRGRTHYREPLIGVEQEDDDDDAAAVTDTERTWEESHEMTIHFQRMANNSEDHWLAYLEELIEEHGSQMLFDDAERLLDLSFDERNAPVYESHLQVGEHLIDFFVREPDLQSRPAVFEVPLFLEPPKDQTHFSITECVIFAEDLFLNSRRGVEISLCANVEGKLVKLSSDKPLVRPAMPDEDRSTALDTENWITAEPSGEFVYYSTSDVVDSVIGDKSAGIEDTEPVRKDAKYEWWKRSRFAACALTDTALEQRKLRRHIGELLLRHDGDHYRIPLAIAAAARENLNRKRRVVCFQDLFLRIKAHDKLPFSQETFMMRGKLGMTCVMHRGASASSPPPPVPLANPDAAALV